MKTLKIKGGFTLIELMIVIAIIGAMMFLLDFTSYKEVNNKRRAEIFRNKISSNIEKVRNRSLMGKGIINETDPTDVTNPSSWSVEVGVGTEGTKVLSKYVEDDLTKIIFPDATYVLQKNEKITAVSCMGYKTVDNNSASQAIIGFDASKMELLGDCGTEHKSVIIDTEYMGYTGSIIVNKITGVISED